MEHFYQNIQGWFNFPNLYKEVVQKFDHALFVEVGSWKGTSSSFMAVEIINSKKDIKLYCVDTWKDDSEELKNFPEVINNTLYDDFVNNMKPVDSCCFPIRNTSELASNMFPDGSLDFVFIDASHKYEDVMNDLRHWYRKVKIGGIIAGHDYDYADVKTAVDEFFKTDIKTQEGCWIYEVKPAQ